jgi:hypothetical protein
VGVLCVVAEEVYAEEGVVVVRELCDFGWPPGKAHNFSPYYFVQLVFHFLLLPFSLLLHLNNQSILFILYDRH